MQNFGIFFNPNYKITKPIFDLLKKFYNSKDLHFFKFPQQNELFPDFIKSIEKNKLDCILSFGGDGTFLRASQISLEYNIPLMGINLGKLGFLSESSLSELEKSIDDLKQNKFKVQQRMLLKIVVKRNSKIIYVSSALNDAVIYKGKEPRLIDIIFYSNKRLVVETRCDGLIVSTPTGSTAYSLSAGGPILSPVMDAFVVTPLNPHVLSVRPMVFASDDRLSFKLRANGSKCILQLDGKNSHELIDNDEIIVTASNKKISFIKLTNKTFYQILRKKLHMGKR
ncbi:MAG: NAD(+)/NADH kinase [Candidatus Delongbacteria bacterium]|nr:NAD(+)/NADH kinase [Candidatus Delongbacteria bacterium]